MNTALRDVLGGAAAQQPKEETCQNTHRLELSVSTPGGRDSNTALYVL